jgi:hypothetical protein
VEEVRVKLFDRGVIRRDEASQLGKADEDAKCARLCGFDWHDGGYGTGR